MSRRTSSAFRNFQSNEDRSGLRASPRILNLSKRIVSPVKIKIASPDVVRSPIALFRKLDAEIKADPCSKESVISAIRKCRKRSVNSEKDRSEANLTEDNNKTKKLRNEINFRRTPSPLLTVDNNVSNNEVSQKVAVNQPRLSMNYGIVSKTPRNAIFSSFSSSRLASNNKKRLFEETVLEEDDVVPSKKFIHALQEKKLPNTNIKEVSVSIVGKSSNQSAKKHDQEKVKSSETESDGQPKLKRTQGHRKMPTFSAIGSSIFVPSSTSFEFTAKDLAETRYQAEQRVKLLRQELKEQDELEQTKLKIKTKVEGSGYVLGTQTNTPSLNIETPTTGKGLPQLTSLIKQPSIQEPVKTSELLTQQTGASSAMPTFLQGLGKSSASTIPPSNLLTSTTAKTGSLTTVTLGQKLSTGGLGMSSLTPVSSTQGTTTPVINFGTSSKVTPAATKTNTSLNPDLSIKNASNTPSGFQFGTSEPKPFSQTGSTSLSSAGQGFKFGGTGDSAASAKFPVGGTVLGSSPSLNQPTSVPSTSTGSFTFGGSMTTNSNNQTSKEQNKSMNLPSFSTSSGSITGNTGSFGGATVSSNIFGATTTGASAPSTPAQQASSSSFQFKASGSSGNLSGLSSGLFPSGITNSVSSQSQKSTFKPIFGDTLQSMSTAMTPPKQTFNPIFGAPNKSKPPQGGFNFQPGVTSVSTGGQTSTPAFAFGAKSSSTSGVSSGITSGMPSGIASGIASGTTGNNSGFNFGSSTTKNTSNTMTAGARTGLNFGTSQALSSGFQFGQSNPTNLQSTQSGGMFSQAQATPAFGQTTQSMTGFGQSSGSAFGQTSKPTFAPSAANSFGQPNQTNMFGQPAQAVPSFGQSSSQPAFGQASSQGANTGFQFGAASATPPFGGFGQASQAATPAASQQMTPSFGQSDNAKQGFNFGGSGVSPAPNFGSGGFMTPAGQNQNFSVGAGGTIARDRKKYAARRKVNKRR
ncbi:uncharacterized protein [Antedon mediterranea]|uniref:uncharacterized protein n=1 Tax=Antedon mediterranea TaxID=105859 RepID=UPI003AF70A4B